jgi:NAD(P)-dependent dehydrogenase (short-subunit alcohol dehydrogenase family)
VSPCSERIPRGRVEHGVLARHQVHAGGPIDQHRADRRRGLDTATVISGYPGSPLGGFDLNLQRNAALLAEHNVRFIPGLNEELGGTILFGGQLASAFPRPRHDGVDVAGKEHGQCARVVEFLATALSDYVTGAAVPIDGGSTRWPT